jgi:hypothetical protein
MKHLLVSRQSHVIGISTYSEVLIPTSNAIGFLNSLLTRGSCLNELKKFLMFLKLLKLRIPLLDFILLPLFPIIIISSLLFFNSDNQKLTYLQLFINYHPYIDFY